MRPVLFSLSLAIAGPVFADGHVTMTELPEGPVRIETLEDGLIMHTFLSKGLPGGMGSVNSHIFEAEDSILIMNAQFYKAAAMDLRSYVEALGKPVERILVSHAHPDHGFGASYMRDLAPIAATEAVRAEAAQTFPFFANVMVQRMGEDAAKANFPIGDLPIINATLEEGAFEFGGTTFEVFDLPSHEVGTETFIKIPEHNLLMVFDAIMPYAHQLVFGVPGQDFQDRIEIGLTLIDTLEAMEGYDKLIFGHNSIEPLPASEQLANAREGLEIYGALASETDTADAFIAAAAESKPEWIQFYVPMTAGGLFPEN